MFDAFTKIVSQADARGDFVPASTIDALSKMVANSNKRLCKSCNYRARCLSDFEHKSNLKQ